MLPMRPTDRLTALFPVNGRSNQGGRLNAGAAASWFLLISTKNASLPSSKTGNRASKAIAISFPPIPRKPPTSITTPMIRPVVSTSRSLIVPTFCLSGPWTARPRYSSQAACCQASRRCRDCPGPEAPAPPAMNPEPVSPTGWRGHGTGPEPAVRDQAQPSPPRLLPISREISGKPSVSMMMSRRLGHTEGQDLGLGERYEPQLCFEFVRLVGSNRTLKDIRSARDCRKRERLGPTVAIDCDHCLQAFRSLRDRQEHALAFRGVDDLKKPRRELALNAEGLGGVMVSVTGGPARRRWGVRAPEPHVRDGKRRQVREEFAFQGTGNVLCLPERQVVVHRDRHIRVELMADPSRLRIHYLTHPGYVLRRVTDLGHYAGLDAIKHARQDGPRRLPHDDKDRQGDQQTDQWVRQWVAEPDPEGPDHNREAGKAVGARVIAIRNQRRAIDLPPDTDAEHRDSLVAEKSEDASGS